MKEASTQDDDRHATPSLGMRVLEEYNQQEKDNDDAVGTSDVHDNDDGAHDPPAAPISSTSNNNASLPVASQVEPPPELLERMRKLEEQQNSVPYATPVEENEDEKQRTKNKRCLWTLAASACIIILAIVLGTVFGVRNNNSSTAVDPTPSPTLSPESAAVKALIESVSLDGGAALQNASSPQFMALEWLQQDKNNANTTYDDWRMIQRYVLAVLYYSTGGDSWINNEKWLSPENECTWFTSAIDPICNETGGRYLRIILFGNDLQGTVPMELALLSDSLCKYGALCLWPMIRDSLFCCDS